MAKRGEDEPCSPIRTREENDGHEKGRDEMEDEGMTSRLRKCHGEKYLCTSGRESEQVDKA